MHVEFTPQNKQICMLLAAVVVDAEASGVSQPGAFASASASELEIFLAVSIRGPYMRDPFDLGPCFGPLDLETPM